MSADVPTWLDRIGGWFRSREQNGTQPKGRRGSIAAALFLLSVLSLVGVPPFSGFVAKLALTEAGFASHEFAVVGISLLVSLLTLLAMIRIWMGVFWNPAEEPGATPAPVAPNRFGGPPLMVIPAATLVLCSLALAAAGVLLFVCSVRLRDHEHTDRLSLLPLEDDLPRRGGSLSPRMKESARAGDWSAAP